jgi:4-hydroxy-tetrahydrodipicolinate synthase
MINLIENLKGTGVAIITPFKVDFSIDFNSIIKLVDYVINGGVNYIVVQGTTGESSTLTEKEKIECRKAFITANRGRVPLIIGIGSNDTASLVEYIINSNLEGFSAILSVTPYYNKPSQEGLFKHFCSVANSSKIPIILYNVPGRTSCNLDPETTIRLANSNKNIIGIKEAARDMAQMKRLIKNKPDHFLIISGDDETAPISILNGADGVISVAAGCIPKLFTKLINFALKGKSNETYYNLESIEPFLKLLFDEGNPAGIKAALSVINLSENYLRLPLVPVSNQLFIKIEKFISENS